MLDITHASSDFRERSDAVICSDVLEHIPRPVSAAFSGLYALIKPSGWLVLTVLHSSNGETVEHFPVLSQSGLHHDESTGQYAHRGFADNGVAVSFGNLVLHGGQGHTLEHRIFAAEGLRTDLLNAGFVDRRRMTTNLDFFGLNWEPWSRAWTARRPA